MAIEALKKCVGTEAYAKAMEEVKGGNAPAVEQERPVRVKETIELTVKKLIRDIGMPSICRRPLWHPLWMSQGMCASDPCRN